MKLRHINQRLCANGFIRLRRRVKGSHCVYRHRTFKRTIVLSGKNSKKDKHYQTEQVDQQSNVLKQTFGKSH